MKVLFAVSECVPFIKTGGLADVAGALPKQLKELDVDVRVVLPNYSEIPQKFKDKAELIAVTHVNLNWRNQYCGVHELEYDGITYYLIDNEYYFKRSGLYGHGDDGERFSFFSRAVLEIPRITDFIPDIIHCHDWHTGMVNFLLNEQYRWDKKLEKIRTVFTIHNLQFQGVFPKNVANDLLELHDKYITSNCIEYYDNINFMKAALNSSDLVTTVSPTYKKEVQYPFFGENLDGLLRSIDHKFTGIVNGIDYDVYNPSDDDSIAYTFDSKSYNRKLKNKKELQKSFNLPQLKETPIIAMVSRLTTQKGLDLVKSVFHDIMKEDVQFIVLGTGDPQFENFFRQMAQQYPNKVSVTIGFNEALAHQIYAGSDMFLMPSLFEPCGLGQMIALRYGAIPIVRETGGLNDTVQSFNEFAGTGNGFTFAHFNAHDMLYTIRRALGYYKQPATWKYIVKEAMNRDYSWKNSANEYLKLYESLTR